MTTNKNNNIEYLDQLLKDTFKDYSVLEERTGTWIKIKKKVTKHQFFKFNLSHFNVYYLTMLSTLTFCISAYLHSSKNNLKTEIQTTIKKTEILNTNFVDTIINNNQFDSSNTSVKLDKVPSLTQKKNTQTEQKQTKKVTTVSNKKTQITRIQKTEENDIKTSTKEIANSKDRTNQDSVFSKNNIKPVLENNDNQLHKNLLLTNDSTKQKEKTEEPVTSPVLTVQKPVIQTDTIVKVIKKRRRRKK